MTTMDRVLIWSRNGRSLEGSVCRSARNNNVKTRTIKHTASPPKYQEMIVKFESDYGRVSDSRSLHCGSSLKQKQSPGLHHHWTTTSRSMTPQSDSCTSPPKSP
jgi:hypothetical protein